MEKQKQKFWTAMVLSGLIGQAAWAAGNMYLSAFIYKMLHVQPADISLMAGACSAAATVITILFFRPSAYKANKLLYAVIGTYALFHISIYTFMPYLIIYFEKTLQMTNYALVFVPAILIAAIVTAVYGGFYDQLGFQTSVVPVVGMLVTGYTILYFATTPVPVFIGMVIILCGYFSGMTVFGAKIREQIPENMAGRFRGVRMIGQILIPGIIGPAIGAFVLQNAEKIKNSDGTFSFLPNKNIWIAALVTAGILWIGLQALFRMIRNGHHDLWTESGLELKKKKSQKAENPWNVYPRPQMKREGYVMLNEGWTLNGKSIYMPFPPQAPLSDYAGKIGSQLLYETSVKVPAEFEKERILLHFGAVDQVAEVWVNNQCAGKHEGGYLPFSCDITDYINRNSENKIVVKVTDTLSKEYPYGKQCKKRGGMWYTPVSGIWQSVWMENVPASYIEKVILKPDLEGVEVQVLGKEIEGFTAAVKLSNGETHISRFAGQTGRIQLTGYRCEDGSSYQPKLWDTEEPYLYDMQIETAQDKVETYFALRTIEICNRKGINRICLNGKPIFMHGVLDQGYYPDGIFLPAEPEEFERDILRMKELGLNFLRKHIKVEPEAFYYYCDKHGMLVMQDMVNNGGYNFIFDTALPTLGMKTRKDTGGKETRTKKIFRKHMKETIEHVYNHPCVIAYTLFNEGWGQFDSDAIYDYAKSLDDTRIMDSTSGWFWQKKNDFDSEHIYFKTIELDVKERPMFVSECGGYSYVVDGHYFSKYNTYGYGCAEDELVLTKMITDMYNEMILPAISKGACGCVYTQLSDVEDEINGLYTYDRQVCKVNKKQMRQMSAALMKEIENIR